MFDCLLTVILDFLVAVILEFFPIRVDGMFQRYAKTKRNQMRPCKVFGKQPTNHGNGLLAST